jgi:DNA primase
MSSQVIELIREKLDIVEIVREYVPALRRAGRNYKANCPFHNEKTPSFTVNQEKQIFHCFGCGTGGDVFKFVMDIEGLSFPEAARKLAQKAGVEYGEERAHVLTPEDRERLDLKKILKAAAAFYHKQLFSPAGERAKLYLGERRLSKATVEKFELGWAPAGGGELMEELKKGGWSFEIALKAGLVTEREGGRVGDTFRGRIMFPIRAQNGDVIAFGGRVLDPEGMPKYLNSPETPLFSKRRTLYGLHEALASIRKTGRLLLLEGYMDVIGAHQHGVDFAVAPLGTNLTVEHSALIKRYAKDTVVMFDDDRAGIQASVRAAEVCMDAGLYVRLANLGTGQDPDEYLNDNGREAFEKKLAEAQDPLDFRVGLFFKDRKSPPTAQEKAKAIAVLLETVAKQTDEILKSEWVKTLASRFGVDEASVLKQLRKAPVQPAARAPERRGEAAAAAAMPPIERGFIQLLLRDPALIEQAGEVSPEDFTSPAARRLFEAVLALPPAARPKAATELAARFPEDASLLMELAVSDIGGDAMPVQNAAGAARMLRKFSLQRRWKEMKARMGSLTAAELEEFSRLTAELKSSAKDI